MSMYKIIYYMNDSEYHLGIFKRIRDARNVLKTVRNEYIDEGQRVLTVGKDCLHIVSAKNGNRKYVIKKM